MFPETTNNSTSADQPESTPFVIEVIEPTDPAHRDIPPSASVKITPALRTSGLLHELSGEEVRNLLLILTFLTPNGWCNPAIQQLAAAMGVGEARAKARLARLVAREWHGKPLVHFVPRESGIDAYSPSDAVVTAVRIEPVIRSASVEFPPTAGRDAVIANSRAKYARPRLEVEREIAELNGWEMPEELMTPAEREVAQVRSRLRMVGLSADQAAALIEQFELDRIIRQLEWLPYRNARNPSGFLVAAVTDDYEPPAGFSTDSPSLVEHVNDVHTTHNLNAAGILENLSPENIEHGTSDRHES